RKLGLDPRPALDRAPGSLERVLAAQPRRSGARRALANVWGLRANYEHDHGGEWRLWMDRAIEEEKRATEIDASAFYLWHSLGVLYGQRSEWETDLSTALMLNNLATVALRRAIAPNPNELVACAADLARVRWSLVHGGDAAALIARCQGHLARAGSLRKDADFFALSAQLHRCRAEWLQRLHRPLAAEIAAGMAAARAGLAL